MAIRVVLVEENIFVSRKGSPTGVASELAIAYEVDRETEKAIDFLEQVTAIRASLSRENA